MTIPGSLSLSLSLCVWRTKPQCGPTAPNLQKVAVKRRIMNIVTVVYNYLLKVKVTP